MVAPPIDGLEALARKLESMERRIAALELANSRTVPIGNSYRLEVQNTGGAATLHAIRSADGNDKLVAP
jgi:hypothetical protein